MPEELNRILVNYVSELLFAPTNTAVSNLCREGVKSGVYLTGDVILDLFLKYCDKFSLRREFFILVTVHRAKNTDDPGRLKSILEALIECSEKNSFSYSS